MALPPVQVVQLVLPDAAIRVLQDDGTLSLPWRRCIQQLVASAGGSGQSLAAIIAELTALQAEVAVLAGDVATALENADQALTEADTAQDLGLISLANDDGEAEESTLAALVFLALSELDALGGGSALEVLEDGVVITADAASLDFEGDFVALSTTGGGHVIVKVAGTLPLVNGDLPGPAPIADGVGQFIAVPLF